VAWRGYDFDLMTSAFNDVSITDYPVDFAWFKMVRRELIIELPEVVYSCLFLIPLLNSGCRIS
jgi:hypothetical protein